MRRGLGAATVMLAFCLAQSAAHRALAAEERSISVNGNGEVKARPNRLELEVQAGGVAELTDDAIVKYDDALRRAIEAFERLKIEHLSIEQGDLSFASMMVNNAAVAVRGRNVAPKPQMSVNQSLKLTLRNVDRLTQKELVATVGKIIDTAHDAGASIVGNQGGNTNMIVNPFGGRRVVMNNQTGQPMVGFLLDNFEALHDEAYQKAFADATSRAEKLAKLAHAKLGDVLSISETSPYYNGVSGSYQQSLVSIRLSEIPVNVSLHVRFELLKPTTDPKETGP